MDKTHVKIKLSNECVKNLNLINLNNFKFKEYIIFLQTDKVFNNYCT